MEKGVTKGKSDEDKAKIITFTLETGTKLSRIEYEKYKAQEQKTYRDILDYVSGYLLSIDT